VEWRETVREEGKKETPLRYRYEMTNGLSKLSGGGGVVVGATGVEPLKQAVLTVLRDERLVESCVAKIHPGHASCALYGLLLFKDAMRQSAKIYVPLYLVSAIVASIRRK